MAKIFRLGLTIGICSAAGILACAAPQPMKMVPEISVRPRAAFADKSLRLSATAGEFDQAGLRDAKAGAISGATHEATITSEIFANALETTLTDSRLFKSISRAGPADYELDALILDENVSSGWPATATVGVRYRLVEIASGKLFWRSSLISECDLSLWNPTNFTSSGSESNANECAMRKNLTELVDNLTKLHL